MSEKLNEILSEIREVRIEQKGHRELLTQHITHCQTLYATKVEIGEAKLKPLAWFAVASITGMVAANFEKAVDWAKALFA